MAASFKNAVNFLFDQIQKNESLEVFSYVRSYKRMPVFERLTVCNSDLTSHGTECVSD